MPRLSDSPAISVPTLPGALVQGSGYCLVSNHPRFFNLGDFANVMVESWSVWRELCLRCNGPQQGDRVPQEVVEKCHYRQRCSKFLCTAWCYSTLIILPRRQLSTAVVLDCTCHSLLPLLHRCDLTSFLYASFHTIALRRPKAKTRHYGYHFGVELRAERSQKTKQAQQTIFPTIICRTRDKGTPLTSFPPNGPTDLLETTWPLLPTPNLGCSGGFCIHHVVRTKEKIFQRSLSFPDSLQNIGATRCLCDIHGCQFSSDRFQQVGELV